MSNEIESIGKAALSRWRGKPLLNLVGIVLSGTAWFVSDHLHHYAAALAFILAFTGFAAVLYWREVAENKTREQTKR